MYTFIELNNNFCTKTHQSPQTIYREVVREDVGGEGTLHQRQNQNQCFVLVQLSRRWLLRSGGNVLHLSKYETVNKSRSLWNIMGL